MIKGLISVIVPVYNVEGYLAECLDSILAQTYTDIEVILIDDGSKDGSGKICDEYAAKDARIKVLHKENGGVSKARNAGLDLSQGEYVTFIDGDDTVDADYIGLMYREMVSGGYDVVRLSWERGNVNFTYRVKFNQDGKCALDGETIDNLFLCANIWGLYRTDLHIRFNENLKNGEDSLFVIENFVKSNRKMLLVSKPYYHYTIVPKSASEMSPTERLVAHGKFLEQVLMLKDSYPRIEFLAKRHALSDYFSVMTYMIDNHIKEENGFTYEEIKKEVFALRASGIRFSYYKDELKYYLYRFRIFPIINSLRKRL